MDDLHQQARRDAAQVLSGMTVLLPPVDPWKVAGRLGVSVDLVDLGPEVSGQLVMKPGGDPKILLNRRDGKTRQRFSLAHEIGHFLRHIPREATEYVVLPRDSRSASGTDPHEIYANQFASELLMPEHFVRAYHQQGLVAWELAKRFEVSREAMRHRLRRLELPE